MDRNWFRIGRFALVSRMILLAFGVGFAVHAILWGWSMGPSILFQPQTLLVMLGPALLPTVTLAILIGSSDRYDDWFWVLVVTSLVFVLEQIDFWLWRGTVDDALGYSVFSLMPILGGWPLAAISYAMADAWTER